MAEPERFVTVHRTADPVEAEMLQDVLEQEGIEARLLGTRNAALIGAAQHIVPLRLEVAQEDEAAARELITALRVTGGPVGALEGNTGGAPGDGDDAPVGDEVPATDAPAAPGPLAPADADAAAGPGERPRSALLAAGAAIVLPGGCHMYARRPWTGLVLLAAVLVALGALAGGRRVMSTCAAFTFGALLLGDLVFGQLAVRATNRGRRRGRFAQLGAGLGVAALAAVLGTLLGLVAPAPKPKPDPLVEQLLRGRPPGEPGGARGLTRNPLFGDGAWNLVDPRRTDGGAPRVRVRFPRVDLSSPERRPRRPDGEINAPAPAPGAAAPAAPPSAPQQ
jgi:hypothetical protein